MSFKIILVLECRFGLDLDRPRPVSDRGKTRMPKGAGARASKPAQPAVQVRAVRAADLPEVIALDATVTGLHKSDYWQRIYRRYGVAGQGLRHFLVAVSGAQVCGFVIGEVRDWEFGSPPCGWVFAIDVDPRVRQQGVGTALLAAMRERFEHVGVDKLRTMLARENTLILSFFRSQGLTAGRLIPLELDIGPAAAGGR
jgi:ribosomal protein S18 acetylase RimI-like enzyme